MTTEHESLAQQWENRYAEKDAMWSGNVNPTFQSTMEGLDLKGGSAVDLGCGEGADVVWLAKHGFDTMGIDLSPTAVKRGEAAAKERGLEDKTTFMAANLDDWLTNARKEGLRFDLVTASFLHSHNDTGEFHRDQILRDAAALVAPGGHLVTVSHAKPPAWVENPEDFPAVTPDDEKRVLDIADEDTPEFRRWELLESGIITRDVTDPDGNPVQLEDGVFVIKRVD